MPDQMDYSFKPTLSGDSILAAIQRKQQMDQETRAREITQKQAGWQDIAKATSDIVSSTIEGVKNKQKRDFINTLAESLASQAKTPEQSNTLRAATNVAPIEAAEFALKQQLTPEQEKVRGTFVFKPYVGKDGQTRYAKVNSATGDWQQTANDPLVGYAPAVTMDEFGNPILTSKVRGQGATSISTPADAPLPVTATQEERDANAIPALRAKAPKLAVNFDKAYSEAFPQNNKDLSTAVQSANSAKTVSDILKQKDVSQTALAGLGFHLARMSGSNSQLSDREREIFEQPLSLIDKITNKGYRMGKGDLSPKMKADLLKLSEALKRKEMVRGQNLILAAKRQAKSSVGRYWNEGLSKQFPTIEQLIEEQIPEGPQQSSRFNIDQDALNDELAARGL